jgi:hypothetical protein
MSYTSVDSIKEIPLSMIPIDWSQVDDDKMAAFSSQLDCTQEQFDKLEEERQKVLEAIKKSNTAANTPGDEQPDGSRSRSQSVSPHPDLPKL